MGGEIKQDSSLPKDGGHEAAVRCSHDEAGDEETARYTSTVGPAGEEEVEHEEEAKRRQGEGTWRGI